MKKSLQDIMIGKIDSVGGIEQVVDRLTCVKKKLNKADCLFIETFEDYYLLLYFNRFDQTEMARQ